MATRFYLPNSGAAGVTPSSWSAGWNDTSQESPGTYPLATTPTDTALATTADIETQSGAGANYIAVGRWVSEPLAAQTISGTIRGVIRGEQTDINGNACPAIAAKVVQSDGSDRAVLLAVAADTSDEFSYDDSFETRVFNDASENTLIPLASQAVQAGDRIVVEIGVCESFDGTWKDSWLRFGDPASSTDQTFADGETNDYRPWVEFSGDLEFASSGPSAAVLLAAIGET